MADPTSPNPSVPPIVTSFDNGLHSAIVGESSLLVVADGYRRHNLSVPPEVQAEIDRCGGEIEGWAANQKAARLAALKQQRDELLQGRSMIDELEAQIHELEGEPQPEAGAVSGAAPGPGDTPAPDSTPNP